jgi:hypothetical protein
MMRAAPLARLPRPREPRGSTAVARGTPRNLTETRAMNTIQTRLTAAAMISLACLVAGCNPAVKSTTVVIEVPAPIVQVEMLCPISGEPVTIDDEAAYIESFVVYCKGRENARQFASLDAKQRGKLGAAQVLPQKGIANTTCPLTGETLTAWASPVVYEGTVIGFASVSDANQFRALKADRKAKMIADWKASSGA